MQAILNKIKNFPFNATFVKFAYTGVIMRGLSIIFNYIFADYLNLNVRIVYFCVLVLDFIIGYLFSRYIVFNKTFERTHKQTLVSFFIAGLTFRGLDWGIYVYLVEQLGLYIILAQVISIGLIIGLKFFTHRWIFR